MHAGQDGPRTEPTFIIAEIGINHDGELDVAKRLIDVAKVAGVDAVKFQKRNPDKCVSPEQAAKRRQTPWGEMSYLEYRHRMEFGKSEFDAIDKHCKERGIEWFASPWDLDSLDFLLDYAPRHLKVPSAMLTHVALLEAIAETGIPTFISTGMSTPREIDSAVRIFEESATPFTLMHCNSSYPAQVGELNLLCLQTLRERYGCPVGYSGHEFGLIPTVVAVAMGAVAIERHVTLKRTRPGSDHMASVEPIGLMKLVSYVRSIPEALGDGVKRLHDSELPALEKLRWFDEAGSGPRRHAVHVASPSA